MRRCGIMLVVLAVLCARAVPAGDSASGRTLPPFVAAHVSIKSPAAFLAAVDEYVAASTRGCENAFPPGLVGMLAQFYSPVPMDSWDPEKELNLVFTFPEDGADGFDMTALFAVDDFPALLEALESVDWLVGGEDIEPEDGAAPLVQPVILPNGKAMVLVRYDGGLVALTESVGHAEMILAERGWTPTHAFGDADAALVLAGVEARDAFVDKVLAGWSRARTQLAPGLERIGIKPTVAAGALKTIGEYVAAASREAAAMRDARVELRLREGRVLVDASAAFPPETLLGGIAARLAEAGDVVSSLEKRVPADVVSYSVTAPMTASVPDAKGRFTAMVGEFYASTLPELDDRAKKLVNDFLAAATGPVTAANCRSGGEQYTVTLTETNDPAGLMRVFADGVDLFNEALRLAAANPDHGVRLLRNGRERDGLSYSVARFDVADEETRRKIREALAQKSSESGILFEDVEKLRFYAAALDGAFVTVVGGLDDDDFFDVIGRTGAEAKEPFPARASVRHMLPDLNGRQFSLGFLDVNEAFRILLLQEIKAVDASSGLAAAMRKVLDEQRDGDGDAALGAAVGSVDGRLRLRVAVPVAGMNALVKNYEALVRVVRRAGGPDAEAGGEGGDADGYDDEGEDSDGDGDEGGEEGVVIGPDDEAA